MGGKTIHVLGSYMDLMDVYFAKKDLFLRVSVISLIVLFSFEIGLHLILWWIYTCPNEVEIYYDFEEAWSV